MEGYVSLFPRLQTALWALFWTSFPFAGLSSRMRTAHCVFYGAQGGYIVLTETGLAGDFGGRVRACPNFSHPPLHSKMDTSVPAYIGIGKITSEL